MNEPVILIVGAADTGRAPLAAAILRRILARDAIAARVESAGILGHDDDPASPDTMTVADQMDIDLSAHRARSLSDDLVDDAALLIAIDTGVAQVTRMRFAYAAERIRTLGELAGRSRDVPDPFKMQIGAWLMYAREIEQMLRLGLPRIVAFVPHAAPPAQSSAGQFPQPGVADTRRAAAERTAELLELMRRVPDVVIWSAAREQIEATIATALAHPAGPGDLAAPYGALIRAALALSAANPSAGQISALGNAIARLEQPIGPGELSALSVQLGGWAAL